MRRSVFAVGCLAVLLPAVATAQTAAPFDPAGGGPGGSPVQENFRITLVPQLTAARPGQSFFVALDVAISDGWAWYSPVPGDNGKVAATPGQVGLDASAATLARVLWPMHELHRYDFAGTALLNNAYEHRAVVYAEVTIGPDAPAGGATLTFTFGGQICSDESCVPLDVPFPTTAETMVVVADAPQTNPAWTEGDYGEGIDEAMPASQLPDLVAQAGPGEQGTAGGGVALPGSDYSVGAGLAIAFLAGLILNIMPCVLPVIPLRILSVVDLAGQSRRRYVTLGLAFAGGVLAFFVGLAVVSAVLRFAQGQAINVSEHFTYAPVRIALAMVVIALAANLFGVFNVVVPSSVAGIEDHASKRRRGDHFKSLGMGLMLAVLATPCSFAFLALAMAWAQTQPIWLGTLGISMVGVGMAAPHALLASFPRLVDRLPRPGAWMELFKQTMGFLLLPVALWLLATLGTETYPFWVAGFGVVLVFCLWVGANWVRYDAPFARKLLVRGLAAVLAIAAGWWMLTPAEPLATKFEPYSAERLAEAREAGRVTLVKFTATWCASCVLVDEYVYDTPEVAGAIERLDVQAVKADVTDKKGPATDLMVRLNVAPPMTVVYPPDEDAEPIFLSGKFKAEKLIAILETLTDESLPAAGQEP